MSNSHLVRDAKEALALIAQRAPEGELREAAVELQSRLAEVTLWDKIVFAQEKWRARHSLAREPVPTDLNQLVEAAEKVGAVPSGDYKSPIFQCLDDHMTCVWRKQHHPKVCLALAVVCVARELIPFIPGHAPKKAGPSN